MQRIIKRLDSTHEKLTATVEQLSPQIFAQRPATDEWSVAEILHHLRLVEDRVIKELERGLAGEPERLGFMRRLVPPAIVGNRMIKVKAPQAMNPKEAPGKELSLANFNETRSQPKALCAAHGRDRLRQTVFKHPFLGKINGVAAVSFLGYHEQRHLKQIREVLQKLN